MTPAEIKGLEYIRDAGVYAYLEETIEQVGIDVWWKLLQLGFVSRDDRGRVTLTRVGRAELAKQAP